MAETRKSPSTKKKTEKTSVGLEKRKEELLRANAKKRHTISIVMFAAGLFLIALSFIGNSFSEKMSAWDHLHAFMYGLFGLTVFFVGPMVIYIAVMISADMTRSTVAKRLFQLLLLLLLVSAAAQVIFVGPIGDPDVPDAGLGDKIGYVYEKGKSLSGGGVFGVVLGFPLLLFGQIGAIIILALITFVAVMIITDKSLPDLFNAVKKPAKKIKDHHDRVAEERGVIADDLKQLEEERLRQRQKQREMRSAARQARREENELNAEQRRRSKFDSIASVTTGAQQAVSEQDRQEAAKIQSVKKDPVKEQKQESAEFRKDLKDYLNVKYGANKMDRPPAFPTESAPVEPYRPDEPKFADDSGDVIPEKHLNPVIKHESLIYESHVPETKIFDSTRDENTAEAPAEQEPDAPYSPVLTMSEDSAAAADDGTPETLAAAVDDDTPPWEDPKPALSITAGEDKQDADDNVPGDNAVYIGQPQINYGISTEKKETDIIDAIKDFTREQQERAAAAEENAKVLGTVIKEDEHGQSYVSEVLSDGETYTLPPLELLNDVVHERSDDDINAEIAHNAQKLVDTLKSFGVETKFLEAARGPSVTRYELQPAPGVKISKITGLVDDIALNLATAGVRIEAPIPNKAAVGIEVPNRKVESVPFREMVDTKEFRETKSKLGAVLGKSISGDIVIADIAKMPHILIAGTTGSGKSVCVNSIIMSILFRSTPDEVRLLMIDPKAVEFMIYNGIPHLLIPVVTDPKKASGALAWAVTEMLNRYKLFSDNNVRDLSGYNKLAKTRDDIESMPQIVIFIDELADLMMASPGEVESAICRLAQMARAAGMHLVIATQRPSVNVVTGVIKANIPSRIALKVASQVDSRTIIDSAGAEKLLGKGDMLYAPVGMPKPMRVQGCWVSDGEVERVVDFIKNSFTLDYDQGVIDEIERQAELAAQKAEKGGKKNDTDDEGGGVDVNDDKLDEAIEAVIEAGQASTSYLQRRLKLGYGRAARLIDTMEQLGVVGGFEGAKPRQVIMTKQEWYERKMNKSE